MTDLSAMKTYLAERRAYLQDRLNAYEAALDERPPADTEDRATEREGDEVLEGLGLAGLDELDRIRAALVRLDEGTYGICMTCGHSIERDRLLALPETVICAHCAGAAAQA